MAEKSANTGDLDFMYESRDIAAANLGVDPMFLKAVMGEPRVEGDRILCDVTWVIDSEKWAKYGWLDDV